MIVAIDGDVSLTVCASQEGVCDYQRCCSLQSSWRWVNEKVNQLLSDITLQALFAAPESYTGLGAAGDYSVLHLVDKKHE